MSYTIYTDPHGSEHTEDDMRLMHDDLLDEIYPTLSVGIYTWSPSEALKRLDPVAYRISVIEYVDQMVSDNGWVEEVRE